MCLTILPINIDHADHQTTLPPHHGDPFDRLLAAQALVEGVVLVSKVGEPVFQKAYGLANREQRSPMSPELRFNYASIGKAFTKTAIGQLISAGKLKLTDTIGTLLPDYPNADAKPATIDQLLNFPPNVVREELRSVIAAGKPVVETDGGASDITLR